MQMLLFVLTLAALITAMSAKSEAKKLERVVEHLRREIARLRTDFVAAAARPQDEASPSRAESAPAPTPTPVAPLPATVFEQESEVSQISPISGSSATEPASVSIESAAATPAPPRIIAPATPAPIALFMSSLTSKARDWLLGGNLVAKVGLLILFIGVSFLLKYAAARVTVPIELRLAGIALGDIALLIWGWRIRERRAAIGLPVQGAALAILMLVTFGAFRLYHLIPGAVAFALLFALTAFTCLLAVLQNASWLAIFGIAGGFAAPVLTSTGHGSHIGLFSYYALLNAGVFAIALHRSWRVLNLVGFAFTFLIGTAWGVLKYAPENYLSAQLFLVLFFVFYVAIAVVYALRQASQLRSYVDAVLVFGTPLVAFGLQYGLVRHTSFGMAFSALALGLFYTALALLLWRRSGSTLRLQAEAFLALGTVFGTLAIPFAFDGRWTSAAWALEGAGIVWIGLRQRQTLTWLFGLLVQVGAWFSFILSVSGLDAATASRSNLWLGFLLLAATAFFMATSFRGHANETESEERARIAPLATAFLALASIWFVAGTWAEIWLHTDGALQTSLLAASALLTALGLGYIAGRMQWQIARYFALVVQALAALALLYLAVIRFDWPFNASVPDNLFSGPFLGALLIGAGAGFSSLMFYRQAQAQQSDGLRKLSQGLLCWCAFWWFALILQSLTGWAALHYEIFTLGGRSERSTNLWICAYGVGLAISSPMLALLAKRLQWADLRWSAVANWAALLVVSIDMLIRLYPQRQMPTHEVWFTYLTLWLAGEWLMRFWQGRAWPMRTGWLQLLHAVRTISPWLMIWPVGYYWISIWLHGGTQEEAQLLAQAGWFNSGSWARYLPVWAMMLAVAGLMRLCRSDGWPVAPLASWYRRTVIPLAAGWALVLVVLWNLTQNGAMAPLPYLPLLNPLDLSTCFASLLALATYRMLKDDTGAERAASTVHGQANARLVVAAAIAAYVWFNLVLLRTVAHYRDIPYQWDTLFASQFVQAMLSIVWSATALLLMRRATRVGERDLWIPGAVLLALVVAKLFLVDLSNVGGVERIISFVGVGLLMVAIGYVAPYPAQPQSQAQPVES